MDINSTVSRIFQGRILPYKTIECGESYVSDALANEIQNWIRYPVLINAPTGSGKSRFVLKDLADYAESKNRWILVLSNRIALNMQQKIELCREKGLPIVGTKSLADFQQFGNIVLCTYQSSESFIKNLVHANNLYWANLPMNAPQRQLSPEELLTFPFPYSQPQFVVLDEAHFFCSDAVFNPRTEAILQNLLTCFPDSIRIYMSATPEDVKPVIAAVEKRQLEELVNAKPHREFILFGAGIKEYCIKSSTDHIRLNFFHEWETVEDKILREKESTEKWLIFVNEKATGKDISKKLTKNLAQYLDAESGKPEIGILARTQIFQKKVLVSTSVIDNGISLCDDDLKNIVIDFSDNVQFMQMLGRKRVKDGEQINVYVRVPSSIEIQAYRNDAERLIGALQTFEKQPKAFFKQYWGKMDEHTQRMIAVNNIASGFEFSTNCLTEYQLALKCGKFEELEDKMKRSEYAYAEQICEWLRTKFEMSMYIDKNIESNSLDKLREYLDSKVGEEINGGEEMYAINEAMRGILSASQFNACGARKGKSRGKASIEKILKYFDLPYELEKDEEVTKRYRIRKKAE